LLLSQCFIEGGGQIMKYLTWLGLIPTIALALSGCAVTPKNFYEDPSKAKDTALCRAMLETTDPEFRNDTASEVMRRGLTLEECRNKVAMETAAIIGIAAVATGVAVVAACSNGCAAPAYRPTNYYNSSGPDYDCAGGGGNGPRFVQGPFRLTGPDFYGLDRDGDGVACEPFDEY
jgi:hypothetical protein